MRYLRYNLSRSPGPCLSKCVWDSSVSGKGTLCTFGSTGASSQENGAADCCLVFGHVPAKALKQRPLLADTLAAGCVFGGPGLPFIEG